MVVNAGWNKVLAACGETAAGRLETMAGTSLYVTGGVRAGALVSAHGGGKLVWFRRRLAQPARGDCREPASKHVVHPLDFAAMDWAGGRQRHI